MKVAFITWHFPPINTIAAVRTGKFARYLHRNGYDIRVITSGIGDPDRTQTIEIPQEKILNTGWIDIDRYIHPLSKTHGRILNSNNIQTSNSPQGMNSGIKALRKTIAANYNNFFFFPDRFIGWIPKAVKPSNDLLRQWKPNLIYVSGPPFSAFLLAFYLSRKHGIPWVAEYRDRWVDDPYRELPDWRHITDNWLETRVLKSAAAIVSVSEPWVTFFEKKFNLPVTLAMNGFDPAQIGTIPTPLPKPEEPLRILHMGSIYSGKRDPSPLFQAIAQSQLTPDQVRVVFFGTNIESMAPIAEKYGVSDFIDIMGRVGYEESLEIQKAADILLLLQWNNIREQGNVPAKLFEYLAVRRPILGIGLNDGVPARIIRERSAGLFSNDPGEIAQQLSEWVSIKKNSGFIPNLPESVHRGFSRDQQFDALRDTLQKVATPALKPTANNVSIHQKSHTTPPSVPYNIPTNEEFLKKPTLCVIVDTEEEFNWNAPFSRHEHGVNSIKNQYLAQDIFSRYGVKPTYLADFPVLDNAEAVQYLKHLKDENQCEIGVQIHPWTNPPFEEELNVKNSFLCNLSPELITKKIEIITDKFADGFQYFPTVFKAGRYGINKECFGLIRKFGYEVDTSVVPHTSYAREGGPDFTRYPDSSFWLDDEKNFLELPLTRGYSGLLRTTASARHISAYIDAQNVLTRKIPGFFARGTLLERITLTPEGIDHNAHRRLMTNLLKDGRKLFCFSYHSASLLPGSTPYVQTKHDLEVLLRRIEQFLKYFQEELGGQFVTPHQAADLLRNAVK
ncbi:MAG: glycosyltransferase [Alphaproteobacteria bacterium]